MYLVLSATVHLYCFLGGQPLQCILYVPHVPGLHPTRHTTNATLSQRARGTCMSSCREKKGSTVADSLAPCLCNTDRSSPPNTSLTGDSLKDVCRGRTGSVAVVMVMKCHQLTLQGEGQRLLLWLPYLHTPVAAGWSVYFLTALHMWIGVS